MSISNVTPDELKKIIEWGNVIETGVKLIFYKCSIESCELEGRPVAAEDSERNCGPYRAYICADGNVETDPNRAYCLPSTGKNAWDFPPLKEYMENGCKLPGEKGRDEHMGAHYVEDDVTTLLEPCIEYEAVSKDHFVETSYTLIVTVKCKVLFTIIPVRKKQYRVTYRLRTYTGGKWEFSPAGVIQNPKCCPEEAQEKAYRWLEEWRSRTANSREQNQ